MNPNLWLKNTTEIKTYRENQSKIQKGLDPILKEPLKRACLDHCHFTGEVRGVLSQCINTFEGYVLKYWMKYVQDYTNLSLSEALRNLADYLEADYSENPLHYKFVEDQKKALKRMSKETIKRRMYSDLGVTVANEDSLKDDLIDEYLRHFIKHYENKEV